MTLPCRRLRLWHLSAAVAVLAPIMAVAARHPMTDVPYPMRLIVIAFLVQLVALPLWASVAWVRFFIRTPGYVQSRSDWVALPFFWLTWFLFFVLADGVLCIGAALIVFDD
jgi:hypothetical protein